MKNGNLADAQLRALIDVAAAAAGAHRLQEVLELAAERSLEAIGAASLSISRWHADTGILQTLVNVGDLGPGEERFPTDETYSVEDFPSLNRLMGEFESSLTAVDDPDSDPAGRALLERLGKEASLAVPMLLEGQAVGRARGDDRPGRPRLTQQDVELPPRDRGPARRRDPPRRAVRRDRAAGVHGLADRRRDPARGRDRAPRGIRRRFAGRMCPP